MLKNIIREYQTDVSSVAENIQKESKEADGGCKRFWGRLHGTGF